LWLASSPSESEATVPNRLFGPVDRRRDRAKASRFEGDDRPPGNTRVDPSTSWTPAGWRTRPARPLRGCSGTISRLARPTVRLSGSIDEAAAASFLSQVLPTLDIPGSIVVELFSSGGEAEVGRRLAQEVRLLRQAHGRDMWFLGKTLVASAAVTFMAAFPRDRRWLTRDTTLLIHGRRMMRNVHLEGPLGSCRRVLEEIIADIDNGLRVEDEGFAELIVGSAVTLDDIRRRSYGGWYLSASQALELGLVAGLV
jgi:ATP-dependent Clp protease, protease subunit